LTSPSLGDLFGIPSVKNNIEAFLEVSPLASTNSHAVLSASYAFVALKARRELTYFNIFPFPVSSTAKKSKATYTLSLNRIKAILS